jgi:hypothetical protein
MLTPAAIENSSRPKSNIVRRFCCDCAPIASRSRGSRAASSWRRAFGGLFDGGARGVELEREDAAGTVERLVAEALHQVETIVELGQAGCGELFWK